ncbi:MAG: FAD-binding oxidoreductase [Gaiellaceae bacterium MAG52_C11]|nr:FAD-binding oxidoreductase [Candidatus Gaiellasilicea maunaloa]
MRAEPAPAWPFARELRAPLPESTDVLIIGGGLAGTALAYYLARAGVECVLVERAELNREASGTNAGSFHFQIALHQLTALETGNVRERLQTEVRLHAEAAEVWKTLERELAGSLEIHITGGLMVAETPDEFRLLHEKRELEEEAGLETHVLEGEELRAFAPYLADDLLGATWCPDEGHANPMLAAPLFAARAAEAGAELRTHAEVTRVEVDPDGGARRFAVTTAAVRVHAHRVVNATGAWANEVCGLVGLRLPIRAEGLHLNVTEPRERVLEPMVQHIGRRLTLKQATNGTFIIGGGWPANPEPAPARFSTTWESTAGNVAVAVRVLPLLADVKIVRTWSGVMAFTADLAPLVGESARLPGFHTLIATTGFTLSPLLAQLLAEELATGRGTIPPQYSIDRDPAGQPTTT